MEKAIPNPKLFISENFYTGRFDLKKPSSVVLCLKNGLKSVIRLYADGIRI